MLSTSTPRPIVKSGRGFKCLLRMRVWHRRNWEEQHKIRQYEKLQTFHLIALTSIQDVSAHDIKDFKKCFVSRLLFSCLSEIRMRKGNEVISSYDDDMIWNGFRCVYRIDWISWNVSRLLIILQIAIGNYSQCVLKLIIDVLPSIGNNRNSSSKKVEENENQFSFTSAGCRQTIRKWKIEKERMTWKFALLKKESCLCDKFQSDFKLELPMIHVYAHAEKGFITIELHLHPVGVYRSCLSFCLMINYLTTLKRHPKLKDFHLSSRKLSFPFFYFPDCKTTKRSGHRQITHRTK